MTTMTVGSLFSGIGGIDLGLERAGMKVIWQSEIKPFACGVLRNHWPTIPNLGDITTIDWSTVARPDIIAGGFPCQDLSSAHTSTVNGSRSGLEGAKSGLWSEYRRAVGILGPQWVVVENVDTWRHWVPTVRADLAGLGYASVPLELRAGTFGAPHRRPRIFLVAHADSNGEPLRSIHAEASRLRPLSGRDSGHWGQSPPRIVLLDDGVSQRVGQNNVYGNAVVRQVAQWVGEQILQHHRTPA